VRETGVEIRKTFQIELSEYEAMILALSNPENPNTDLVLRLRRAWQSGHRSDFGSLSAR
jgi:hypothetical protein